MSLVSLRGVGKTYHLDAVAVPALHAIDLDIDDATLTVIAGPSGSGKTTLLNLIGCVDRADGGSVVIDGTAVHELAEDRLADFRARHVGFVFQHFNLLPVLTAYENVEYPLVLAQVPADERRRRVLDLLQAVGLADRAHNRPGQLSGGQRQRVAIARALATLPRLVLADEPTASLDSHTGAEIIALMRRIQRERGVCFVVSSHDPQVHAAADEVVVVRDGAVAQRLRRDPPADLAVAAAGPAAPAAAPEPSATGSGGVGHWSLAWRNLLRNRRRSLTTLLAMSVGLVAVLLFGGYRSNIVYGLETGFVQQTGHLQVQRKGYFIEGGDNPGAYGIRDAARIMARIRADTALAPMVVVLTPTLQLGGIAGNFAQGLSRSVAAFGVEPVAQAALQHWNPYGLVGYLPVLPLAGTPGDSVVVGTGVARRLRLCSLLPASDCLAETGTQRSGSGPANEEVLALSAAESTAGAASRPAAAANRIELLVAAQRGAPNVASLNAVQALNMGIKALDDAYLAMHLPLAQRLVYGSGASQVTAVVLQLQRSEQMPAARARLQALLKAEFADQDLEVLDFQALNPIYGQTREFMDTMFGFIAMLIGVIVLFTIGNTMGTAVVERTVEIGTLRTIGLRRSGIRQMFITEGVLLGLAGAVLGVSAALLAGYLINHSGLAYTPPGYVYAYLIKVRILEDAPLLLGSMAGLMLVAIFSAWWPANRASRLLVVDALRHA